MAEHHLDDSVTQPFWDNSVEPRLTIDSGDTVVFECPESVAQITPESTAETLANLDFSKIHALIGSVFVKGAKPGGTLQVEVLDMQHKGWGWSGHIPHFGLLPDDFDFAYLHHWRLDKDVCYFGEKKIEVPFEPFCGVMGVAPKEPGRLDTIPPRANGGNVDIRDFRVGATVWLPVWVEGALFSTGDCHSAQGQGEVCGTGIESPMTVTLRLTARDDMRVKEIQFQTGSPLTRNDSKGYHVTTAHGPDLMVDSQNAVRYMVDWLVSTHGLTKSQAYVLCSQAGDLKISEIVDAPNWLVSFYMPLSIFK